MVELPFWNRRLIYITTKSIFYAVYPIDYEALLVPEYVSHTPLEYHDISCG